MSDAPQGPGWWQANNDKWYPPEAVPGPRPAPAPVATPGSTPDAGGPAPSGQGPYAPPAPPTSTRGLPAPAIIAGAVVLGVLAIAVVCILAVTFLGQKATSRFVPVGPAFSD